MKKINLKNPVLLTVAAAIWGFAFAAQSEAMDYIGPFTLNCIRNLIGAMVLVPVIFVMDRYERKQGKGGIKDEHGKSAIQKGCGKDPEKAYGREDKRLLLTGGICCGLLLSVAANLQQLGIKYTTVGKAGFITALYIVLVPVAGLFFKKKCGLMVWVSIGLALTGFYFLTMIGESSFTKGDGFVLLSALVFTGHILCVDYFSPRVSGVKLACLQFLVCGVMSGIVMLCRESLVPTDLLKAWAPILYTGVLSCGVAYTFQILGQRNYNPAVAALIMSLESVFSVLGGWLILHETLSLSETAGCILIFAGIILSQIPREWYHRR